MSYIYPPTTGNPDVEKSRSHAPRYDTYVVRAIVNKHFKTVLVFSSLLLIAFRFRAICVVVEFHSSHSFCHFAANSSSFSYFFRENSTGFDVFNITVRFVSSLLCCCRVPLQPQFRQFFSEFFLIFVVFCGNSTTFVSRNLSSFALCCQCCVVVDFHSSHSYAYTYAYTYAYAYANSRPPFRLF